ncbi:rod shape-determining protein MreC [bacterium]|nr:MAG: rod shape-determining protein MreC [bacterium]
MRFIYTKTFLIFAGVLVAVVIALFLQVNGWLGGIQYLAAQAPKPVINFVTGIFRPITSVAGTLGSMKEVVAENNSLREELTDLRQRQVNYDQLQSENELLKSELGFKNKEPHNLQPCTVLSRDTQGTNDSLILNCGEPDGVQSGQGVVSGGYLVAKIVHVGKYTSTAVLITNNQSSIDARVSRNNVEGVIKGSFGSGLVFDLVSQSADVAPGDLVVTAGIDPQIPKNIMIGQVGQELSGQNDLFKKLTLVSPIKAHQLDFVFVIK